MPRPLCITSKNPLGLEVQLYLDLTGEIVAQDCLGVLTGRHSH